LDIREKLMEAITPHNVFNISLFGLTIPVSDTVIVMWIVMVFLIIFAFVFTRKMKLIPEGKQNVTEIFVGFINSFAENNIGHHWRVFAPYLGTILLFLVFSNMMSLFNVIPSGEQLYSLTHIEFFKHFPRIEIKPPTRDINVTVAMALMSMAVVVLGTIRVKKFSGWLKTFTQPMLAFAPFKVLDYFIRPTSLSLRLFGNILGAYIVMELIYFSLPPILPAVLSIYFDLFDALLQAYVFVFLTSFYIAESVE